MVGGRMRARVIAVVALAAAVAAPTAAGAAPRARAFASCAQLAAYAQRYAVRPGAVTVAPAIGAPGEAAPTNAPEAPATGAPDSSQTNVVEQRIDEPDLV